MNEQFSDAAVGAKISGMRDLWPLATTTQQKIFQATLQPMNALFQALGLDQRGLPFTLIQAAHYAPGAISGVLLCERFPYSAAQAWEKLLLQLQSLGYVDGSAGRQHFRLNGAGADAFARFVAKFDEELLALTAQLDETVRPAELTRLADTLTRVVMSAGAASGPAGPHLAGQSGAPHLGRFWSKQRPPTACALHQIDYLFDCLNAYRDDAHLASFAGYELPGYTWELFTFIWQGRLQDIVDLADRLGPFRGYDARTYHQGLMQLVGLGWVEVPEDAVYRLTPAGRQLRDAAEAATDDAFYRPWLILNEVEILELRRSLRALKTAVTSFSNSE